MEDNEHIQDRIAERKKARGTRKAKRQLPMVQGGNKPAAIPGSMVIFAQNPLQMQEAQEHMVAWAEGKVSEFLAELADLEENLAIAKKNKWRTSTLRTAVGKAKRRLTFYSKTLAALEEGYVMVPNFPVGLFAIRTSKKKPKDCYFHKRDHDIADVYPDGSPEGEGRYVDTEPNIHTRRGPDGEGKMQTYHKPYELDTEIRFPFTLTRPEIMEATSRAMALKIFDEIGCLPRPNRGSRIGCGDPIIVGTVKIKEGWNEKQFSFMIAWFMDLKRM